MTPLEGLVSLFIIQQGHLSLSGPSGFITLSNFDARGLHVDLASGATHADVQGSPVHLEILDRGITLTCRHLIADVARSPDGGYRLDSAQAIGEAQFTENRESANRFRSDHGLPALEGPVNAVRLTSASFDYRSSGESGTFTIPGAFQATESQAGEGYGQEGTLTGTSGKIQFSMAPGQATTGQGAVEGPVTYALKRTETPPSKAPTITTYDLSANRLTFDFTKTQGVVTAIGDVHVIGKGSLDADLTADKIVLTTDANRRPLSLSATGGPPTTVIKPKGPG